MTNFPSFLLWHICILIKFKIRFLLTSIKIKSYWDNCILLKFKFIILHVSFIFILNRLSNIINKMAYHLFFFIFKYVNIQIENLNFFGLVEILLKKYSFNTFFDKKNICILIK